ncbi:MAG: restriction endonuclease [Halothiobacillaceae bacterium]|nr:restriction endonuclease [Halothiobacillaceae bacterium]
MRIEVAVIKGASNKEKGDLLEKWAEDLVRARGYEVTTQVRKTAAELDLQCRHPDSGERVYVECKAHTDALSATVLRQILGTLDFDENLDRAWLVSAGPLGKDAKGFMEEWESKPPEKRSKLIILTPDRVIAALVRARLICAAPEHDTSLPDEDHRGTWVLLLTPDGPFWAIPVLSAGVPEQVIIFSARSGRRPTEREIAVLAQLDWSYADLEIRLEVEALAVVSQSEPSSESTTVIPVAVGDQWRDYRPARPEDFVGRKEHQDRVLALVDAVAHRRTRTRVFALLGDSGMGKSSLIVKLQDRFQNKRHRGRMFMLAVDVRAARSQSYPYAALIECLTRAAAAFGYQDLPPIKIEDQTQPLSSASVQAHLSTFERDNRVVCLVFDQFEELYSKPELFAVFEAMQRLLLDVVGMQSSLVLGFAWKTDATVHQDHPAYHMWHRLADHRYELTLRALDAAEVSAAVTKFEKELGEKLNPALRRQVMETSRGLPWLLKILSIHLLEQLEAGKSQAELIDGALDAKSLFDRQIQSLNAPEVTCLRAIAATAPADWYEVIETFGTDVLRSLVDKRLVVRSGDRVAVYWDIFREYLLTKSVPPVPVTYLPTAPSLHALIALASELRTDRWRAIDELAGVAGVAPKTAGNIVRDLVMLGVATREGDAARLVEGLAQGDEAVLGRLRESLSRHALMAELRRLPAGSEIHRPDVVDMLRRINPAAHHRRQTWEMYADRMIHWLVATGYVLPDPAGGWRWEDTGTINLDAVGPRRRPHGAFTAAAPPEAVVEALAWFIMNGAATTTAAEEAGYRNPVQALGALGLLLAAPEGYAAAVDATMDADPKFVVWKAALSDPLLSELRDWRRQLARRATGVEVGRRAAELLDVQWSKGSLARYGNALARWCDWLDGGADDQPAPFPGRRRGKRKVSGGPAQVDAPGDDSQAVLFRWPPSTP